jgi:hypothetical protein
MKGTKLAVLALLDIKIEIITARHKKNQLKLLFVEFMLLLVWF